MGNSAGCAAPLGTSAGCETILGYSAGREAILDYSAGCEPPGAFSCQRRFQLAVRPSLFFSVDLEANLANSAICDAILGY